MVLLCDTARGRDNNLNLIRMLAAAAVLVSHSVPIAVDPALPEPLKNLTGMSLGTLAVMMFFVISGFLIPVSFERSSSRKRFLWARALRIFPGLFVNLLFVAFLLGPLVTTLPLTSYFTNPEVYLFVLRDMLLVPLVYSLPGVFEGQPLEDIVGSIWTLRHEVGCYIGVFIVGVLGLLRWRWAYRITSLAYFVFLWPAISWFEPQMHPLIDDFFRLSVPFALGMVFHAWQDRLPLSLWGVAVTALLAWAMRDTLFYFPAFCLAIGYATFWLGYIPGGFIRAYNRFGDYSYGIYVYAFPLQGWAVWAFGPQTAFENVLYSAPPTLLLSVLSWHFVEKPALDTLKKGRIPRGGDVPEPRVSVPEPAKGGR
ncbi:acyltransferase [Tropicimonas sp. TH_r6]|uniref:acyltransferase family protein n=1 Tax=Tropicimonas sp. TH_r6 TaxID=3082085 RepID=UPI002954B326|nr:acyltransferase [Tropicimonas sp. TH_r6]MDV7145537.1 acyltransferase [Tropicimonas sp. TH_r6]